MFEKVNPMHPDKIADRIAGALVDMAYKKSYRPTIAAEVLIGHGECHIICETSETLDADEIAKTVERISQEKIETFYKEVKQDPALRMNQKEKIRCGDNGIFKGVPITDEQRELSTIARNIFAEYPSDGKYILDGEKLVICQSHAATEDVSARFPGAIVNPLGYWTGGTNADTGAVNRKLGSDMGDAVTGGGLHGKDLSKADVAVNIYAHMLAQNFGRPVKVSVAIGDEYVMGAPYSEIVKIAGEYIALLGGFEKFAEWGLI